MCEWIHIGERLPLKGEQVVFTSWSKPHGWQHVEIGAWTGGWTMGNAIVMDYGDDDDWYPCSYWLPIPCMPPNPIE